MGDRWIEYIPLDDIVPAIRNPKRHDLVTLDRSFDRFGYTEPPLMDERTGRLVAGHGRLETAIEYRDKGKEPPDGVKVEDGVWSMPVVRGWSSPNDDEANAYLVSSNRTPELGGWDPEELFALLDSIDNLDGIGYTLDEVQALANEVLDLGKTGGSGDPDAVPATPKKPRSQRGDVWICGAHRVMCGDSTDPDDVLTLMGDFQGAQLLHADPPYGMGKEKDGVENDNLYRDKLDKFQMEWWKAWRPYLAENASAYIWGNAPDLWRLWYVGGLGDSERLTMRNEIVWAKGSGQGMSSEDFRSFAPETERCLFFMLGEQGFNTNVDNYWEGWEPIRSYLAQQAQLMDWDKSRVHEITGMADSGAGMHAHWFTKSQWTFIPEKHYKALQDAANDGAFKREYDEIKAEFYESRNYFDNTHDNMTDVWQFQRVKGDDRHGHATPKPVEMMERALKTSCPMGGVVVEPFAGSGSTLIGAQNVGVSCYTMELKPEYVDVVLERWQTYTGQLPMLESTGEAHDFKEPQT